MEDLLSARRAERIAAGGYSADDAAYIAKMQLALCPEGLETSDARLEKLRRLCQLWDVDLRIRGIASHRRFIGPVIVAAKKLIYPMLRVLLSVIVCPTSPLSKVTLSPAEASVIACRKDPAPLSLVLVTVQMFRR